MLHYADGKRTSKLPEVPPGVRLGVAGDKIVVVIAADYQSPIKGPVSLKCWQRSTDGKWTGPSELAREEGPLFSIEKAGFIRLGYVVQAYAPANFVPLAWPCDGQKWLKYLRVPVPLKQ